MAELDMSTPLMIQRRFGVGRPLVAVQVRLTTVSVLGVLPQEMVTVSGKSADDTKLMSTAIMECEGKMVLMANT